MISAEMIVITIGGALMGISGFLATRVLERIEKDLEELKKNTADFKSFADRAEIILEYHEKRLDECMEVMDVFRYDKTEAM